MASRYAHQRWRIGLGNAATMAGLEQAVRLQAATSRHSPTVGNVRESGRLNDCNLTVPFASASGGIHFGNFSARSIAWKRGSLRSGSRRGSAFRLCKSTSRSRNAVSNHSSALEASPHCA